MSGVGSLQRLGVRRSVRGRKSPEAGGRKSPEAGGEARSRTQSSRFLWECAAQLIVLW